MSEKTALIFGAGGHARVFMSIIKDGYDHIQFVTSNGENDSLVEKTVLDGFAPYKAADCFIAIGNNQVRKNVFDQLIDRGANLPNIIAPSAYISPDALLGRGNFIGAGASLVANARVEDNIIINSHSAIDHDCVIGSSAQITAGVVIAGGCCVGEGAFMGIQSGVIPGLNIGKYASVMAGTLVTREVKPYEIVGGSPLRSMGFNPQG